MISIQAFAVATLAALIAISAVAEAQDGAKTPATAPPAPIDGEWVVADKTARIHIAPCGDGDSIRCGTLSWTRTPGGVDSNNPDPAKRNQPLLGVELIKVMRLKSQNRWEGSVYNARDGKTYDAALVPQSPTTVKIEGCVLGGLLCAGETWTRGSDITGLIGTMPPSSARPRSVQPR